MNPLISIIVPIYNVSAYIEECLLSVLEQNVTEIELILVNDCSTDDSMRRASEILGSIDNVKIIEHQENKGLGAARNSALMVASGEYLMMLDSDDRLTPQALKVCRQEIRQHGADIIHFGCNKVTKDSIQANCYLVHAGDRDLLGVKEVLLSLPSYVWLNLYRREFIENLGLRFEYGFYEDIPWTSTALLAAESVHCSGHSIYNYRLRPGSIVNSTATRHLDMIFAHTRVIELFEMPQVNQRLRAAVHRSFISSAYYLDRDRENRLDRTTVIDFAHLYLRACLRYRIISLRPRHAVMQMITVIRLTFVFLNNRSVDYGERTS